MYALTFYGCVAQVYPMPYNGRTSGRMSEIDYGTPLAEYGFSSSMIRYVLAINNSTNTNTVLDE